MAVVNIKTKKLCLLTQFSRRFCIKLDFFLIKFLFLLFSNELEREFLRLLQFNTNVPQSVFVKYYFELRTLAEANDLAYPPEPLSRERAGKLEAMSLSYDDKVTQEVIQASIRRWASVDKLFVNRRNPLILSWKKKFMHFFIFFFHFPFSSFFYWNLFFVPFQKT